MVLLDSGSSDSLQVGGGGVHIKTVHKTDINNDNVNLSKLFVCVCIRNPDNSAEGPWCFKVHYNEEEWLINKMFCNIPLCNEGSTICCMNIMYLSDQLFFTVEDGSNINY